MITLLLGGLRDEGYYPYDGESNGKGNGNPRSRKEAFRVSACNATYLLSQGMRELVTCSRI